MNIRTWAPLITLTLLAACAHTSPVAMPDGTKALAVECDGDPWTVCMNRAAKACGKYTILSQDSNGSTAVAIPVGYAAAMVDTTNRTMIVRCER